jgi:hypothetical protein
MSKAPPFNFGPRDTLRPAMRSRTNPRTLSVPNLPQLFFALMSVSMIGVKFKGDNRDRYLHHGHPLLKLGLWLLFTLLPFLFPNEVLNVYSKPPVRCDRPNPLRA